MLRRKIFAGRTTLGLLLSACWSEVSQVLRNWASGGFRPKILHRAFVY
jgi:hypothetical protein